MGRTKLTDKQKKKIIADYVINNNYLETAKMNGNISPNTVKSLVNNNKEVAKKCNEKEEENTNDILEYIDTQLSKQKQVIELSLDALNKKLKNPDSFTNVKDIATVYGIFTDKALKSKELKIREKELKAKEQSNNNVEEMNKSILNIANLINNPPEVRTEGSLNE